MTRITIGIVADNRRRGQALALSASTLADTICFDDGGTLGCTENHLRVWSKVRQLGGDWGVVLEDDAIPVLGFRDVLQRALADPPADIVGLYLGTGYPREWQRFVKKAVASDADWIASSHLLHGVGTAIRSELIPDMLRFVGNMSPQDKLWPVDEQITHWCRLRGHKVAYTHPSLVDHADTDSLVDHFDGGSRQLPRRAHTFGELESYRRTSVVEMP